MLHLIATTILLASGGGHPIADLDAFSAVEQLVSDKSKTDDGFESLRLRIQSTRAALIKARTKPNEKGPLKLKTDGGLLITRGSAAKARDRAGKIQDKPLFGTVDALPKSGDVWTVEFPNYLSGGYLGFVDTKSGDVVLLLPLIEG